MPVRLLILFLSFWAVMPTAWSQSTTSEVIEITQASSLRREAIALANGEGVPRNLALAVTLYCQRARLGDAQSQYELGWMYANGRGVERSDAVAAFFFSAAAQQGLMAAKNMLQVVGNPSAETPVCMQEPVRLITLPQSMARSSLSQTPVVDFSVIAPRKVFDLVMQMAPQYQVEPQLAFAIMAAESNFDSLALSPRKAQGLMQLIPETSERFKVKNAFDPSQNIRGGLAYLRWLLAYFEGDVALVAAAYNAGEGKVERYRGVPPYKETQAYVERILKAVGAQVHAFDARVTRPSPALALIRLPWLGR